MNTGGHNTKRSGAHALLCCFGESRKRGENAWRCLNRVI